MYRGRDFKKKSRDRESVNADWPLSESLEIIQYNAHVCTFSKRFSFTKNGPENPFAYNTHVP